MGQQDAPESCQVLSTRRTRAAEHHPRPSLDLIHEIMSEATVLCRHSTLSFPPCFSSLGPADLSHANRLLCRRVKADTDFTRLHPLLRRGIVIIVGRSLVKFNICVWKQSLTNRIHA
jgi:hypothetical protein